MGENRGERMKIAGIQLAVVAGQIETNFKKAEEWIRKAAQAGADVVVLPEMFVGGFLSKLPMEELADPDGKRTKSFLSKLSKELNMNIVGGSVATTKAGKYYNTAYVADRQGQIIADYDKIHLFSYAGEEKRYSAGESLVEFFLDGIKCSVMVCYDLRFPEIFRKQSLSGCEIIFLPAQWPTPRIDHWRILNQARAIENQLFMVSINGCGKANKDIQNGGNSLMIDPWGEIIADGGEEPQEKMIIGDLDLALVKKVREKMTVFVDRQPLAYRIEES
ncbi:carbon-nitrogen family hydrolase [Eubacteriaceae bacterium ES3]|nr:carbon-nitrogen family hydrolase [Eubacteriaceae bacterium ES3]